MSKKQKSITVIICLLLALALSGAMSVFAYLFDSETATNTFTVGKVEITLDESDVDNSTPSKDRDNANLYKMIPGTTLVKDPVVTVKAGSEDCWVFVEVIEETIGDYVTSDFLSYSIPLSTDGKSAWNKLDNTENVYYCRVEKSEEAEGIKLPCLEGGTVVVKDTVTEEMMEAAADAGKNPELNFIAYAFQYNKGETEDGEKIHFTAEQAWEQLKPPVESGE